MKLNNLNISKQINTWLVMAFLLMAFLSAGSIILMDGLLSTTTSLYEHPLPVRRAIDEIRSDTYMIHWAFETALRQENYRAMVQLLDIIRNRDASIQENFDILYLRYLGPKEDIDELVGLQNNCKTNREDVIQFIQAGDFKQAASINLHDATVIASEHFQEITSGIDRISDFSKSKADELYQAAHDKRYQNILQITLFCIGMLIALVGIGYSLRKGILPPLTKLTEAASAMHQGKLDTRVQYEAKNEMGMLSRSFNAMAETIQTEIGHKENVAYLSSIMLQNDSQRSFCHELLKSIMLFTESQMGAVYFIDVQKRCFEPYESIGAKYNELRSFSASAREGEFGAALVTKAIQHLTDIPSDIQVVFSTVSGDYKPKEIITIPIVNGAEVISVISLASIKSFSPKSVRLLNDLLNEITARLNALLANQKIHDFSQMLQSTNTELQQQAKELEMQADELTEQNAELEMQKRQLNEVSKLKTSFLSNMSHELRTPLNSVIALSGVLSRKLANKIPKEEYSYLEIIERNGKNLLTLINDVLDISRIEAGREEIEINRFNANHAIGEVVAMIQPQAQQQNVELLYESEETVIISSDVDKFRHILQNLVGNAVKFTEKGKVTISSQQSKNNIIVKVIDTGIGISAEHLPYIFDEFRQADGSTSRRFGGSGLGLAIAKKTANLLGGTISVKSILNKGSEFILSLPLQYADENRMTEQVEEDNYKVEAIRSHSRSDHDSSEKTILLIEDNESAIIQIKDLVEEIGFRVKVAHDAGEAFKIIDQAIPDAIMLDLMMPDVDGFKVLEIMRNAEPTACIPVLILTAKHITKEELKFLKRNNIHQLIQKGDVKRVELQKAVIDMLYPAKVKKEELASKKQIIEGKPVVLVVEDNPDNMITVRALLEDHHTVLEAVNAYECIEMAKKYSPNLILMDIALPDISGIEAFQQIRKITQLQNIPVIALTASAMMHDREAILSYGFDAFIAKPIIAKEFFVVIREVLYGK